MSVGPIAKLLVKRAGTEIDGGPANADGAHQADEVGKRRDPVASAPTGRGQGGVAAVQLAEAIRPAESAAVTAALLPIMGPIAKPLVARLVRTAVGSEDFYVRLAKELPGQKDKDMLAQLRAKFRVDNSR